ncbi:unnamed protein product [Ilex paraguariensis]|uniref:Uncharacterized protein n=1 Tax=Ilex paraguariensis TaxID=185542 RepID=A0ABC8UWY2_9AQUA
MDEEMTRGSTDPLTWQEHGAMGCIGPSNTDQMLKSFLQQGDLNCIGIALRKLLITIHLWPHSGNISEEADLIERNDEQQFLSSADFLSNDGLATLISNMQAAASGVLKG